MRRNPFAFLRNFSSCGKPVECKLSLFRYSPDVPLSMFRYPKRSGFFWFLRGCPTNRSVAKRLSAGFILSTKLSSFRRICDQSRVIYRSMDIPSMSFSLVYIQFLIAAHINHCLCFSGIRISPAYYHKDVILFISRFIRSNSHLNSRHIKHFPSWSERCPVLSLEG